MAKPLAGGSGKARFAARISRLLLHDAMSLSTSLAPCVQDDIGKLASSPKLTTTKRRLLF
jgi:hypothetical protein